MTGPLDAVTFVDTHVHLDDGRFEDDLDTVLADAVRVGVKHVINIGYRPPHWRTSIALAERRDDVSYTLGLHPHHADEFSPKLLAELEAMVRECPPVAIGEIGLDYFRDFADRGAQRRAFEAQLDLAARFGLPVVIHQRGEVEDDLQRILEASSPSLVCILHSFDGSNDLADYGVARGYLFGVGGLITWVANARLRRIIQRLPWGRILLETDAPYLTPAGVKDRRNSPANIPRIAACLAELKGVTIADVAVATTENAVRTFGLPRALLAPAGLEARP